MPCSNASLLKVHTRTVDAGGGVMERTSSISSKRSVPTVASESLAGSALVRWHGLDDASRVSMSAQSVRCYLRSVAAIFNCFESCSVSRAPSAASFVLAYAQYIRGSAAALSSPVGSIILIHQCPSCPYTASRGTVEEGWHCARSGFTSGIRYAPLSSGSSLGLWEVLAQLGEYLAVTGTKLEHMRRAYVLIL